MNNKKSSEKQKEDAGYEFLNERVVKSIRKEFKKYIRLVLVIALFISITALVIFAGLKTEIKDLSDRLEEKETQHVSLSLMDTTDVVNRMSEDIETTDSENMVFGGPFTEEEMYDMVVIIERNGEDYSGTEEEYAGRSKYFSGLIVARNEDLYIFTYNDKLLKGDEVTVYYGEQKYDATVVNYVEDYNFSIIRVSGEDFLEGELDNVLTAILSDREEINNSENIILIGNPAGGENIVEKGRLTLTENTVSILDATLRVDSTDINACRNENGFIFNENGILLGIAVNDSFSQKVSMIEISGLKSYINRILNKKSIPYIGIYGREVTDEVIEKIDKDMPHGIYISNTKDSSPAYKAGIMSGDVIVAVAGKEVLNFGEYLEAISGCQPRQQVRITVMRKGKDNYKKIGYEVTVGGLN